VEQQKKTTGAYGGVEATTVQEGTEPGALPGSKKRNTGKKEVVPPQRLLPKREKRNVRSYDRGNYQERIGKQVQKKGKRGRPCG